MCYIMVSNNIKRAVNKVNVHCSFVWGNKDVCCLKLNEDIDEFIKKTSVPSFNSEFTEDDFINMPEGYLYSKLLDTHTFNVKGRGMEGFVNADKLALMDDEEQDVYFNKKYKDFSEWLSDNFDLEYGNMSDAFPILLALAKINKVGGVKKFFEMYESDSIDERGPINERGAHNKNEGGDKNEKNEKNKD